MYLAVHGMKGPMNALLWIIGSTIAISLIAWIGLITLAVHEETLKKITLPLVAFAAGALLGGAFLHLLPESVSAMSSSILLFEWLIIGFLIFFVLEQFLNWHHCHVASSDKKEPVTYLILVADGVHNFIGGLAIAGSFIAGIPIGMVTWLASVAHEIPQELGDFGILIHGGWSSRKALVFNFVSALTVVVGGLLAYFLSASVNTDFLLPFAAGNFIYIAASDLIPEIQHTESQRARISYTLALLAGLALVWTFRVLIGR